MAIELSPDTERQVQELVQSGRFASAEEFVLRSVEYYRERDLWINELANREDVQRQIEDGVRDLEEGRYTDYDDESLWALFEQIKREGRQELGLPADAQ
jgi:Arc/MetJ-type ribon-helix-helix transcriptional regulator